MSIVVVLHEASRTGAPRVGGLIAAALQRYAETRVVCLGDGPLVCWLRDRVGAERVTVLQPDEPRHRESFSQRVDFARAVLEDIPSEFVYVNSAAAAEFVIAASDLGKIPILHVHEKAAMLRRLLEIDLLKLEVLARCAGVVLAASGLERDLENIFGFVPERCLDFGIAIDVDEIRLLAGAADATAYNASGDLAKWGDRLIVGMCGHASTRKGADIFFEVAAALPEIDFVWVGNWNEDQAPENVAVKQYYERKLPNLYVTDGVDNPYKYISRFDLFFLSSRTDPNPLVLAEALSLGVPTLSFSKTTAVADFLGRSTIVCHGVTNIDDSVRVIRALERGKDIRSPAFRPAADEFRRRFDITYKITPLIDYLASIRA